MASPKSEKINLEGQVALVTGAANGIGKAVARTLAREGADLVISDLKQTSDTETEIKALGRQVTSISCDVSKKTEVGRLVDQIIKQNERLDIVVHCAGVPGCRMDNFLELPEEEWNRVIDINLKGTFLVLQSVLPHMIAKNYGKIVCLGSLAATIGSVNSGPQYIASKGGIHALIKWACKMGAEHSVFVNGIAPGPVQTDMIKGLTYPDHLLPLQRLGETEDIAEAALFLVSQASNWMTGIILDVNGGFYV